MGTLYENIIALCNQKGIKGGKMCTDLGISKGLLTDLKMGRRSGISASNAQKIASYFDVTVGYLLGEEEQKEKAPTPKDERHDVLDEVDVAFYGEYKELDEEQKATIRDMVAVMRSRKEKRPE